MLQGTTRVAAATAGREMEFERRKEMDYRVCSGKACWQPANYECARDECAFDTLRWRPARLPKRWRVDSLFAIKNH